MPQEEPHFSIEVLRSSDAVGSVLKETQGHVILTMQCPGLPPKGLQTSLAALRDTVQALLTSSGYEGILEVYVDDGCVLTREGQRPVSKARGVRSEKTIVLKQSRPHEHYREPALEKLREASFHKSNQWIPKLYGFRRVGETTYSAHEEREGVPLDQLLSEGDSPLPLREYMEDILPQVLASLEFHHQQELIHGDVKLSNFSVDSDRKITSHDESSVALFGTIEGGVHVTQPAPPEYSDLTLPPYERKFRPASDTFKAKEFLEVLLHMRENGGKQSVEGWHPADLNGIQALVHACGAGALARPQSIRLLRERLKEWWEKVKEYGRVEFLEEFHRHTLTIKRREAKHPVSNQALQEALAFLEGVKRSGISDPRLSAQIATLNLWLSYPQTAAEQYQEAAWRDPLNGYQYALDISEACKRCDRSTEATAWRNTAGDLHFPYADRSQILGCLEEPSYRCLREILQRMTETLADRWRTAGSEQERFTAIQQLLKHSCRENLTTWQGLSDEEQLRAVLRLTARINVVFKHQESERAGKGNHTHTIPREELEHLLALSDALLGLLPSDLPTDFWLLRGQILHTLSTLHEMDQAQGNIYASAASEAHDHALAEAPPGDPAIAQCLKFYVDTGQSEKVRLYAEEVTNATPESSPMNLERRIAFEQNPDCHALLAVSVADDKESKRLLTLSCAIDSSHIAANTALALKALAKRPPDLASVASHAAAVLCQNEGARKHLSDQLESDLDDLRREHTTLTSADEGHLLELYHAWNAYVPEKSRKVLGLLAQEYGLQELERAIGDEATRKREQDLLKRMEDESRLVGELQKDESLTEVPTISGAEVAVFYQPNKYAGGDGYWFHRLPDGRVAIFVYDESGHGIPAAFRQVITSERFSANADALQGGIRHFAHIANNRLPQSQGHFTTALFTILDPVKRELQFVNYGHGFFAVLRGSDVLDPVEGNPNASTAPLKVAREIQPEKTGTMQLQEGDRLVYFCDGWVEAMQEGNGTEIFGRDRFHALLKETRDLEPEKAKKKIHDRIIEEGYVFQDDATLVLIDMHEEATK